MKYTMPKGVTHEIVMVTPEMAKSLLEINTMNRPMHFKHVEALAGAMLRGEWRFNGDTIRVGKTDDGPVLLDGQNRLSAIVKTGISLPTLVVGNLDPECFPTVDRGAKRTVAQVLAIKKEKHYAAIAAACRVIFCLEEGLKVDRQTITPYQVMDILDAHPEVRFWVGHIRRHRDLHNLFGSELPAVATIGQRKYGLDTVLKFVDQLGTGENLKSRDPAYVLRSKMIGIKTSGARMRQEDILPLLIKAFRAYIDGRTISVLRMGPEEAMPEI